MTVERADTGFDSASVNASIAARLEEYADLLESQGEDGFRVRAYRRAAQSILAMQVPVAEVYRDGGIDALVELKTIGQGIAAAIAEMLATGKWRQLDRLQGEVTPEALFMTVPGIGPKLAHRLVDDLDVENLEALEAALRLGDAKVPGVGPRRQRAILAALDQRLSGMRRMAPARSPDREPPVALLLEADRLYREKAQKGELRRIAPKRFNPEGRAWLPIMHARRGSWHLTVLYSNTARAHELGRTTDWVVIYFHDDEGPESQRTVVTEKSGELGGKRVVRGREDECVVHYQSGSGTAGEEN